VLRCFFFGVNSDKRADGGSGREWVKLGWARDRGRARDMPEEKEKTMVRGERRTAQRIKRVLADITPQHLEQLTKQARALTGDYEMVEVQRGASMEVIRARLSNLQQRHSTLRDKLTNAYPPHRDFDENMESEFRAGETERVFLEGESWNDDVITELQRRIWENGSTTRGEEDQDIEGKPELDEKPRGMTKFCPLSLQLVCSH
jgi:hypothetical protein